MVDLSLLWGFVLVSAVVIIAPGADTMVLIRSSMDGGVRAGLAAFAGICTGNFLLTLLVSSGLGLVLSHHPRGLLAVQVVGGIYLLWLALGAARSAWSQWRHPVRDEDGSGATVAASRRAWTQGIVSNLTNAKIIVFYLSFLPQFMGRATNSFAQLELYSLVFLLLAAIWQVSLVLAAARMQHLMQRRGFAVGLEAMAALVFGGLGAAILVEALR